MLIIEGVVVSPFNCRWAGLGMDDRSVRGGGGNGRLTNEQQQKPFNPPSEKLSNSWQSPLMHPYKFRGFGKRIFGSSRLEG